MSKEIDYLFEMHKKYAPTEMVGTYECETDESEKWFDNIIIVKKKLEVLEIIKEYFILTSEYGKISFELKKNIPEDKYDLLKEVLS